MASSQSQNINKGLIYLKNWTCFKHSNLGKPPFLSQLTQKDDEYLLRHPKIFFFKFVLKIGVPLICRALDQI